MTSQQSEEKTSALDRAGKRKWGYNVAQVDEFLERAHEMYENNDPQLSQEEIQLTSFDLERNGYVIGQVDATLIRLERAIVDKNTQTQIAEEGRSQWDQETLGLAQTLQQRAEAPNRQRFKPGLRHHPSYDRKQVDLLVMQTWTRITQLLGIPNTLDEVRNADLITSSRVANAIFTQRNAHHGYDESSVDAYLNRAIQVLTRVESVERMGLDTHISSVPMTAQESLAGLVATSASSAASHAGGEEVGGADSAANVSSDSHAREQAGAEAAKETQVLEPLEQKDEGFAFDFAHKQANDAAESKGKGPLPPAPAAPATSAAPAAPASPAAPVAASEEPETSGLSSLLHGTSQDSHYDEAPVYTGQAGEQNEPLPPAPAAPHGEQNASAASTSVASDTTSASAEHNSAELNNGEHHSAAQDGAHHASGDEDKKDQPVDSYFDEVMNSSVSSTGSFEIPSLTFGGSQQPHTSE